MGACSLCGGDHRTDACPDRVRCGLCGEGDHTRWSCPERREAIAEAGDLTDAERELDPTIPDE